jgi:hypothetical protein
MKAGDSLKLIIASTNERELAFRYPTPADEKQTSGDGRKRDGSGKNVQR